MVVAREGETVVKIGLPNRFQEAIDEAAMRLGDIGADAYLDGWARTAWILADGTPDQVAQTVSQSLIEEFSNQRVNEILDALGGSDAQ